MCLHGKWKEAKEHSKSTYTPGSDFFYEMKNDHSQINQIYAGYSTVHLI